MNAEAPPRWLFYAALLFGAAPLVLYYLIDASHVVFQDPVSLTGLGLVVLAAALPVVRPAWWVRSGLGVWAGSVGASVVYVFTTGPGTLWPIAVGFAAMAAAVPIALGTWLGFEIGRLLRRRGGSV